MVLQSSCWTALPLLPTQKWLEQIYVDERKCWHHPIASLFSSSGMWLYDTHNITLVSGGGCCCRLMWCFALLVSVLLYWSWLEESQHIQSKCVWTALDRHRFSDLTVICQKVNLVIIKLNLKFQHNNVLPYNVLKVWNWLRVTEKWVSAPARFSYC